MNRYSPLVGSRDRYVPPSSRPSSQYSDPLAGYSWFGVTPPHVPILPWAYSNLSGVPLYGLGEPATYVPVQSQGHVAPAFTSPWLKRAGWLPLAGSLDANGVLGYSWESPRGYGRNGGVVRLPRTLLIFTDRMTAAQGTLFDPPLTCDPLIDDFGNVHAAFQGAMDSAVPALQERGVDVHLLVGPSRFATACPVRSATVADCGILQDSDNVDGPQCVYFGFRPDYVPASDLTAGDVMVVLLSHFYTGYDATAFGTDSQGPYYGLHYTGFVSIGFGRSPVLTGYYSANTAQTQTSFVPPFLTENYVADTFPGATVLGNPVLIIPTGGTGYVAKYQEDTTTIAAERDALLAVAARCRTFRVDVGGGDLGPVEATAGPDLFTPDVFGADARIRGGLPGGPFSFSNSDYAALAQTIVTRALTFFS